MIDKSCSEQFLWNRNWDLGWFRASWQYYSIVHCSTRDTSLCDLCIMTLGPTCLCGVFLLWYIRTRASLYEKVCFLLNDHLGCQTQVENSKLELFSKFIKSKHLVISKVFFFQNILWGSSYYVKLLFVNFFGCITQVCRQWFRTIVWKHERFSCEKFQMNN